MIEGDFAVMHKTRPEHDKASVTEITGRVKGKIAIVGDDVIMTGGTLLAGAQALREHGATAVWVFTTHGLFSDGALDRFAEADLAGIVVTDTVPIDPVSRPANLTVLPDLGPPRRDDHERLCRRVGVGHLRRRVPALLGPLDS